MPPVPPDSYVHTVSCCLKSLFFALGSGGIEFDEFLASFQSVVYLPSTDELASTFKMMDENGDGFLSKEEIKNGLIKCGEPMSNDTVDEILRAADKNNDGKISYEGKKYLCKMYILHSHVYHK